MSIRRYRKEATQIRYAAGIVESQLAVAFQCVATGAHTGILVSLYLQAPAHNPVTRVSVTYWNSGTWKIASRTPTQFQSHVLLVTFEVSTPPATGDWGLVLTWSRRSSATLPAHLDVFIPCLRANHYRVLVGTPFCLPKLSLRWARGLLDNFGR